MKRRILALLVIAVFFPQAGHGLDRQEITNRTTQLQKMSPIERDRLNRNIAEFQKLTDAEKEHYRKLHQELKHDAATGGGLNSLLQTYSVWVQTLTPTQRDEIQKESNPSHRFALVRRFKDEQEEPSESPEANTGTQPETVPEESISPLNSVFTKRDAFLLKDLKAVLKVLSNHLASDKNAPEFKDPQLADFVPLIHASVQSSGGNYPEWPEQKLLQEMIAAVNKDLGSTLSKLNSKTKRDVVIRMLLLGVMKQARDGVKYPDEEEKLQILKEMKPAERERIMNQPADRMKIYLIRKSMEMRGGQTLSDFKKIPEYQRQVEELFNRFEVSPPPRFPGKAKKAVDRPKK